MQGELLSHVRDLADRSYKQNIYTFTGFLTLNEQSEVHDIEREMSFVDSKFFGGTEDCERKMLRFGSEDQLGYDEEFPISILVAEPAAKKFADDLNHRDFLGALMNLGINRDILGDIIVKDNMAYIFCEDKMADYIKDNLLKVKHTIINCTITKECPENARPDFEYTELVVSSNRIDAIIAKVFNLSRNQSSDLFKGRCVFMDGRLCENSSASIKNGSAISVRGYGKFIFEGILGDTKKGRSRAAVRKYI